MSSSTQAIRPTPESQERRYAIVVVGASWGGLEAITRLVGRLPEEFPVPVVVIQHRGRDSQPLLAELLQERTPLRVREPQDKEPLRPGNVYVAPADYHLLVAGDHLTLKTDAPVRYSRPSIDVTFSSAAETLGPGVIGIVLTGANSDGSLGLRSIVDHGGAAIIQDPATAEMPVMPRAAQVAVPEAPVVPVDEIAFRLVSLINGQG